MFTSLIEPLQSQQPTLAIVLLSMLIIIIIRIMISNIDRGVHIFEQFNFLDNIWTNFSHNSFFIGNKRKSFGFVGEMLMAPLSYFASNVIINIYIPLSDTNDSFVDKFSKAEAQLFDLMTKYIIVEEVSRRNFSFSFFSRDIQKFAIKFSNHICRRCENSAVGSVSCETKGIAD